MSQHTRETRVCTGMQKRNARIKARPIPVSKITAVIIPYGTFLSALLVSSAN